MMSAVLNPNIDVPAEPFVSRLRYQLNLRHRHVQDVNECGLKLIDHAIFDSYVTLCTLGHQHVANAVLRSFEKLALIRREVPEHLT